MEGGGCGIGGLGGTGRSLGVVVEVSKLARAGKTAKRGEVVEETTLAGAVGWMVDWGVILFVKVWTMAMGGMLGSVLTALTWHGRHGGIDLLEMCQH